MLSTLLVKELNLNMTKQQDYKMKRSCLLLLKSDMTPVLCSHIYSTEAKEVELANTCI